MYVFIMLQVDIQFTKLLQTSTNASFYCLARVTASVVFTAAFLQFWFSSLLVINASGLQLHFCSSPFLVFLTSGLHLFWSSISLLVFTSSGLLHFWSSTGHNYSTKTLMMLSFRHHSLPITHTSLFKNCFKFLFL